jgi:hypothetical protein
MNRVHWVVAVVLLGMAKSVWADPRPFTFTSDAYPEGKGNFEYEQYAFWRNRTDNDPGYNRVDLRHAFEYGVTDKFDIEIYVANWSYEDAAGERTRTHYDSSGIEAVYYFTNPVVDPLGIALYTEFNYGEDGYEIENKLILQKDWKNWTFAYNLVLETEVEREDGESATGGVLGQSLGALQSLSKSWSVGAELRAEWEYAEWSSYEAATVYAGPVVRYVSDGPWWVTLTPAIQLTDEPDEADFYVRLIFGWEF